ncbi:hypothetical protein R3P38DRAFT_897017 [Favolaschia claudopus]|uniref:DUF6535 domain-containing protein n=1 Tax=Favolaschia claudopus TaxID=2862362 RepID=A0AAW0BTX7_9AGAR
MLKTRRVSRVLPSWHDTDDKISEDYFNDSPFRRQCTNDAEIWTFYLAEARRFDENRVRFLNDSVDPLLIFAGLFSAILTAFLVEVRTDKTTNGLLASIVLGEHTISEDAPFQSASTFRWINALWFTSLLVSLGTALFATVARGWTSFSIPNSGSSWMDVYVHSRRLYGMQRWQLNVIVVQSLPLLLHAAVFLFITGLGILLLQDDHMLGILMLALMAGLVAAYLAPTILRAAFQEFPIRTPLSEIISLLFSSGYRRPALIFPSSDAAQKAMALAWLLQHSSHNEIIDAAIRAIAGLPFTIAAQDELTRGAMVASTISKRISSELFKDTTIDPVFLRGCFFALLHLVQTRPLDLRAADTLCNMVDVQLANLDIIPTQVYDVALCFMGRTLLIVGQRNMGVHSHVFDMDIPVLANCCRDLCLLRSLREVCQLGIWCRSNANSDELKSLTSAYASTHRLRAHAELSCQAIDLVAVPEMPARFFRDGLCSNFARSQIASFLASTAIYQAISEMIQSSKLYQEMFSWMRENDEYFDDLVHAFAQLARNATLRNSISTVEMWAAILQYCSRGAADAMEEICTLIEYEDMGQEASMSKTASNLIECLEHKLPDVRARTLELCTKISPKYLVKSDLLSKIVDRLADASSSAREKAVAVVSRCTQDVASTPKVCQLISSRCTHMSFIFLLSLSELSLPNSFPIPIPEFKSTNELRSVLEDHDDSYDESKEVKCLGFLAARGM